MTKKSTQNSNFALYIVKKTMILEVFYLFAKVKVYDTLED